MKVVFLDRETLSPGTKLAPLGFDHTLNVYARTTPGEVIERIKDAAIVIVNKTRIDAQHLAAAPLLKLIAVAATGTDSIDVAACAQRGIAVCNIRNYAVNTVPEHTFALIFALRRSLLAYRQAVRDGRWQQVQQFCFFDFPIKDLAGSILGVFGDGVLGQAVGRMANAMGMRVLYAAHKGRADMGPLYTPFEQVLENADILTLHCPLTRETRNMIGASEFDRMKRKPLLVNTARGGLVDEHALATALRSGKISGAGFDVVSEEPPALAHPFMSLLELPNFILTPHTAWASDEAMQGLADQLVHNIEEFCQGRPANLVQV